MDDLSAATGLNLQGLSKTFTLGRKQVHALAPTDLGTAQGTFLSLLGPSGCGKSTVLRILAGLETPTSGTALINGMSTGQVQREHHLGIAFQDAALLPWRTVESNIRVPLEVAGIRPEPGLVEDFAAALDVRVEWTVSGEEDLVTMLDEGEIDVAVGGFTEDNAWVDEVGLTRPYTGTHVMMVPMGENALQSALERWLDDRGGRS